MAPEITNDLLSGLKGIGLGILIYIILYVIKLIQKKTKNGPKKTDL